MRLLRAGQRSAPPLNCGVRRQLVRTAVRNVVVLGQLPAENSATVDRVRQFEEALRSIEPPLTDAEAEALVPLFGPDNCFGLSWTLVHLIESAPSWPIEACLRGQSGWVQCLRQRATNAGASE
jgi:hypothetical protein